MGFGAVEQKVDLKKPMTVVMKETSKDLDEVVVVGYQEVRRKDLTGAVGEANLGDILQTPVVSFDKHWQVVLPEFKFLLMKVCRVRHLTS